MKDGGQKKRPVAPCGLSFANLLGRRHTQACYLLFCLPRDRFINSLYVLDISASLLSVAE